MYIISYIISYFIVYNSTYIFQVMNVLYKTIYESFKVFEIIRRKNNNNVENNYSLLGTNTIQHNVIHFKTYLF